MKSGPFHCTFMWREENTSGQADRSILGPYREDGLSELASD